MIDREGRGGQILNEALERRGGCTVHSARPGLFLVAALLLIIRLQESRTGVKAMGVSSTVVEAMVGFLVDTVGHCYRGGRVLFERGNRVGPTQKCGDYW